MLSALLFHISSSVHSVYRNILTLVSIVTNYTILMPPFLDNQHHGEYIHSSFVEEDQPYLDFSYVGLNHMGVFDRLLDVANIMEELENDEQVFLEEDRVDGKYYLGSVFYEPDLSDHLLLDLPISVSSFFKYDYSFIDEYMDEDPLCILQFYTNPIEFVTPHGETQRFMEYCAIDKTFWLREFQRVCRKKIERNRLPNTDTNTQ